MKKLVPLLLLIVMVLAAGGAWFHTFRRIDFEGVLFSLAAYLPWGLAQEYALNGYFLNRFDAALSRRAASILTALLFFAPRMRRTTSSWESRCRWPGARRSSIGERATYTCWDSRTPS
jgi:hypothetical protein